jgi:hypothetical protein
MWNKKRHKKTIREPQLHQWKSGKTELRMWLALFFSFVFITCLLFLMWKQTQSWDLHLHNANFSCWVPDKGRNVVVGLRFLTLSPRSFKQHRCLLYVHKIVVQKKKKTFTINFLDTRIFLLIGYRHDF